jgi:hypothetical protein
MDIRQHVVALFAGICFGCASHAGARPAANAVRVADRDDSGQLVVHRDSEMSRIKGPDWLAALTEGDEVTYRVTNAERQAQLIRFTVKRMERRQLGVAALLVPDGDSPVTHAHPYWLAADEDGLYQLDRHVALLDPQYLPLDAVGHVARDVKSVSMWRLPKEWQALDRGAASGDGFVIEELQMVLDGPVRGDRCAVLMQRTTTPRTVMTVCANVGIVEIRREEDNQMGEVWELVEIRSARGSAVPTAPQ